MANPTGNKGKDDFRTGTTGQGATGTTGVADKARDMASSAVETVRDTASNVADRAKDMASNVADTARDWASTAGHKVSDAASSVGSGLGSLASSARENVPGGEYVADALESGTRYFQEHSFRDMADDLSGVIRRNPIPALLIGIGIGFLLARSTRS